MVTRLIAVAVALAIVVGAGLVISGPNLQSRGTTTHGSTTSITCTTTGQTTNGRVLNATFSSNSTYPVRIDSVSVSILQSQGGPQMLQFEVWFTNVGTNSLYVVRGCGSSLSSSITSGDGVVRTLTNDARCLCAEGPSAVLSGQTANAVDPGCWSGYSYQVVGRGEVTANLIFHWSESSQMTSLKAVGVSVSFAIP